MDHLFQYNPLRSTTLAGKIQPLLSSLLLSTEEIHVIFNNVSSAIQLVDLIVLCALGWMVVPALGAVYAVVYPFVEEKKKSVMKTMGTFDDDESEDGDEDGLTPYQRSYVYLFADHLSQMAKLGLLVYACDCIVSYRMPEFIISIFPFSNDICHASFLREGCCFSNNGISIRSMERGLECICKDCIHKVTKSHVYEIILNACSTNIKLELQSWLARRLQSFKSYFIRRALNRAPKNCDKLKLINNILDAIVLALLLVKILDFLSVETNYAVTSLFAVGTTGGFIISLASQEIAKGVMSGVEMAASSRFYVGDHVHFGDG
jgi:hypothetical protein